jgi:hypothetical protein
MGTSRTIAVNFSRLDERVRPFVRNDACRELTFLSSREADRSGVPYSA